MAGYSGTPLAQKLGIRPDSTLALLSAPPGVVSDLPHGVRTRSAARGTADVVVAFFTNSREFETRLDAMAKVIFPDGGLWIAWPKRASGVPTDMTDGLVREAGLAKGLVDNKVCAIDDTWTGLRLVWRLERRGAVTGK